MNLEQLYKLRCETCGVIESEDRPDGLFDDLQDASLRREAHKEIQGPEHGAAIISMLLPQQEADQGLSEIRK